MPNTKKSGKSSSLGRGLQRHHQSGHGYGDVSQRHTSELTSVSVTENTSIDDFLADAEAAQRSFAALRGQAQMVDVEPPDNPTPTSTLIADSSSFQSVPRRPSFLPGESGEAFRQREQDAFLQWKRGLNSFLSQSVPFEKNVEFWRQFWHMLDLSQVVVQVVDARDPDFFRNEDLEHYVEKEMSGNKMSIVMLNKADLLSRRQREIWAQYYEEQGAKTIFFSAALAANENGSGEKREDEDEVYFRRDANQDEIGQKSDEELSFNTPNILLPVQLMRLLLRHCANDSSSLSVGFLGYPNVGKSSSINGLLKNKRLRVSATPGKTKHFQTHVIHVDDEEDIEIINNESIEVKEKYEEDSAEKGAVGGSKKHVVLVDGPGLVMVNPTMTRAQMVLNGILPIDTLTEYSSAMEVLVERLGLSALMEHYNLPRRSVVEAKRVLGQHSLKNSDVFLNAFCLTRGILRVGGLPDAARGARVVLKDYVQGRLLYVLAPPNVDQKSFDENRKNKEDKELANELKDDLSLEESLPELRAVPGVHMRGHHKKLGVNKKHGNKNKREKARRLYKNVDD